MNHGEVIIAKAVIQQLTGDHGQIVQAVIMNQVAPEAIQDNVVLNIIINLVKRLKWKRKKELLK